MGQVANTVRNSGVGLTGRGFSLGRSKSLQKFSMNASRQLEHGSKTCPIISECRDICSNTDFKNQSLNVGVLALATMPSGGQFKMTKSTTSRSFVQALSLSSANHSNKLNKMSFSSVATNEERLNTFEAIKQEDRPYFRYGTSNKMEYVVPKEMGNPDGYIGSNNFLMIADSPTLIGNAKLVYDKDPTDIDNTLMRAVRQNVPNDSLENSPPGIWKSTCAMLAFDHLNPTQLWATNVGQESHYMVLRPSSGGNKLTLLVRSEPNDDKKMSKIPLNIEENDIIVIFSDGISGNINDQVITRFVQQNIDSSNDIKLTDPYQCADQIVQYVYNYAQDLTNEKYPKEDVNGPPIKDDMTVVIAQVHTQNGSEQPIQRLSSNGTGMDRYLSRWALHTEEEIQAEKDFIAAYREPRPPPAEIYRWDDPDPDDFTKGSWKMDPLTQ